MLGFNAGLIIGAVIASVLWFMVVAVSAMVVGIRRDRIEIGESENE